MSFFTNRKRAEGLGSAQRGTQHFWLHMVSSILLQVLIPLFVITFACGLGGTYEEVLAYYSRPFPVVVTALTLIVGMVHLLREVHEAVEDYVHGVAEKLTLVATQGYAYALIAFGLFALVRLAV